VDYRSVVRNYAIDRRGVRTQFGSTDVSPISHVGLRLRLRRRDQHDRSCRPASYSRRGMVTPRHSDGRSVLGTVHACARAPLDTQFCLIYCRHVCEALVIASDATEGGAQLTDLRAGPDRTGRAVSDHTAIYHRSREKWRRREPGPQRVAQRCGVSTEVSDSRTPVRMAEKDHNSEQAEDSLVQLQIITPSYPPDFERCRLLCETMDRYVRSEFHHVIIVDSADYRLFKTLSGTGREVIQKEDLLPLGSGRHG
jgi:hypothetical protein